MLRFVSSHKAAVLLQRSISHGTGAKYLIYFISYITSDKGFISLNYLTLVEPTGTT